ncbi:hypothetical protein BJ508DRAFT_314784 [Ascobolus immersus RN42]|uniref:Uncharacterized protein n=1 Tax=Ascobolus immersus RN42 TaxID=1160509 RepID=A0A3N4HI64_ASCIM|nr:hypothetical protein BJ508DRAFT_314784 [Ascobolus immersus RN42]
MLWSTVFVWLIALSSPCTALQPFTSFDRDHFLWGLFKSTDSLDYYIPDSTHHITTMFWYPYRKIVTNAPGYKTPTYNTHPRPITSDTNPVPTGQPPREPVHAPVPSPTAPAKQPKPPRRPKQTAPANPVKPEPSPDPDMGDRLPNFAVAKDPKDIPGYEFTLPEHRPDRASDIAPWTRLKWYQFWYPDLYPHTPEGKKAAQEKAIRDANNGELIEYISPANFQEEITKIYKFAKDAIGSGFIHYYGDDYKGPPDIFGGVPYTGKDANHLTQVDSMPSGTRDYAKEKPYRSAYSEVPQGDWTNDDWYANLSKPPAVQAPKGSYWNYRDEPYPEFQYYNSPNPTRYAYYDSKEMETRLADYEDLLRDKDPEDSSRELSSALT